MRYQRIRVIVNLESSLFNQKMKIKRWLLAVFLLSCLQSYTQTDKKLFWDFPLPRVHTGILLGNGTQGLMVWGQSNTLNITVGRAGFWDHRGGNDFATRINYKDLKRLLQEKKADSIAKAFEIPKRKDQSPNFGYPQQIGGGRIEITLPKGWNCAKGELNMHKGEIKITVQNKEKVQFITIRQSVYEELAWVSLDKDLVDSNIKLIPAYEFTKETLKKVGIAQPDTWNCSDGHCSGFTQKLPDDLPLTMFVQKVKSTITLATALRESGREFVEGKVKKANFSKQKQEADLWWKNYWASVPKVNLPDLILQEAHDYGLYKQACCTPPQGIACTLQGPFMEDYQIVPWSNDYHFNINAQMIYYPTLMSGKFEHLMPLWRMIDSWKSEISKNGESFFNQKGALMLPHAVDDRCNVVGTFWTGTIDHACTAWTAQLAWLHYQYSGDKTILEKYAYPLLVGAFEGYWAMLEESSENGYKKYNLPVSISPEYRGSNMDAWGKNASFQLAALHAVCQILPKASAILNKDIDSRWAEVSDHLPHYSTFEGVYLDEWKLKNKRIALWEGMDLIESHRHHSHLGAIYPFVTIDPNDKQHKMIVNNSLAAWRYRGAGGWAGWSIPWTSMIMARAGHTEGAINWLHYWNDNFVNEGRGTNVYANNQAHSILSQPVWQRSNENVNEVMQLDAGFGALTAVYELLVQNRLDGIHVLPNKSIYWKNLDFQDVWAEGGFKVSAKVKEGSVVEVKVTATRENTLKLHHYLGGSFTINGVFKEGEIIEKKCQSGEVLILGKVKD
jgi:alpha-L-fucosidase 2